MFLGRIKQNLHTFKIKRLCNEECLIIPKLRYELEECIDYELPAYSFHCIPHYFGKREEKTLCLLALTLLLLPTEST